MALGPRLDIRQTQALVLTPQLQQAIRLLQLSNLELEAVIAEEMAKNPLLEAASGDDEAGPPPEAEAEIPVDSLEEPAAPGADELMVSSDATSDQPLDYDWNSEALETDSFSDAAVSSGGSDDDGPDFERMEYAADSLAEHLLNQLHGAGGQVGQLARAIAEMLEETGYLTVPCATLRKQPASRSGSSKKRWRWFRTSIRQASALATLPNAWRCRRRRPTATTRRWRG